MIIHRKVSATYKLVSGWLSIECRHIFCKLHIHDIVYGVLQTVLNMIVSADGVQMARGREGGPRWKSRVICSVATPLWQRTGSVSGCRLFGCTCKRCCIEG